MTPETAWEHAQESAIFQDHQRSDGIELTYRQFLLNRPKEVTDECSKVRVWLFLECAEQCVAGLLCLQLSALHFNCPPSSRSAFVRCATPRRCSYCRPWPRCLKNIHTCIYVYIYIYVHVYIYILHVRLFMYKHASIYIYICIYI